MIPDGLEPLPVLLPGFILFIAGVALVVREIRLYRRRKRRISMAPPDYLRDYVGGGSHMLAPSKFGNTFTSWNVDNDKLFGGTED